MKGKNKEKKKERREERKSGIRRKQVKTERME